MPWIRQYRSRTNHRILRSSTQIRLTSPRFPLTCKHLNLAHRFMDEMMIAQSQVNISCLKSSQCLLMITGHITLQTGRFRNAQIATRTSLDGEGNCVRERRTTSRLSLACTQRSNFHPTSLVGVSPQASPGLAIPEQILGVERNRDA